MDFSEAKASFKGDPRWSKKTIDRALAKFAMNLPASRGRPRKPPSREPK